jgi:uncharacterized protein (TIGR00255 family)
MKSMTGFGRGEASNESYQASVDISTVNRKQLDIRFSPPKEAMFVDALVRNTVSEFLSRGTVNIQLKLNFKTTFSGVKFNDSVIASYIEHIEQLKKTFNIETPVSLSEIFQLPGAVESAEAALPIDEINEVVEKALRTALENLVTSRQHEGTHLKKDLLERRDLMVSYLTELKERSSSTVAIFREKLLTRIREAGLDLDLNNDRLYQEVVLYADRTDITEEIVRLVGHMKLFANLLDKKEPVGRELDFLMQEINRETNTCASKSSDSEMARLVVSMKAEIERCREQVQNVE